MANGSKNADDRKMQTLLEMGFYPRDCREALEAAGGDSAKALEMLLASEARVWHKQTARRINSYLHKVRPWSEFFDRFLYPEHWQERVNTNLAHYHANYVVVSLSITAIWLIAQPDFAFRVLLCLALAAIVMAQYLQQEASGSSQDIPVELLAGGGTVVALLACAPYMFSMVRLAFVCSAIILCHASFRARTMTSRWSRFSEDIKTNVKGITRDVQGQIQQGLQRLQDQH